MLPREVRCRFFQERVLHLQLAVTAFQLKHFLGFRHSRRKRFSRCFLPVRCHPAAERRLIHTELARDLDDSQRIIDYPPDRLFLKFLRVPIRTLAPLHMIPRPFRRRSYWIPVRKGGSTSTIPSPGRRAGSPASAG